MYRPVTILAATALLISTAPLSAQNDVREACMPDIRKLCSAELGTFSSEKVRICLIKNIKITAPACQAAVKARRNAQSAKKGTS